MPFLASSLPARTLFRRFATAPPPKSSNTALYLTGAGLLGLAGYFYMDYAGKTAPIEQSTSAFDPDNFKDFKLKKIIPYNHNTSKFVFELPNQQATLLPVASCIVVKSSDPEALKDANGKPIIRPYTPISPPEQKGEFMLMVKRYEAGNASKHIHSLKEGDTLSVKGPIPKWPYKKNEFQECLLIGGGSGITPLYQVLSHALTEKGNTTKFTLLYGNVSEKDILLRPELDELKAKYPNNLEVVYVVDKGDENWTGPTGFIGADLIKKYADPSKNIKIFVCGPLAQVASIAGKKAGMKQGELGGILKELGYTEEQVFKF